MTTQDEVMTEMLSTNSAPIKSSYTYIKCVCVCVCVCVYLFIYLSIYIAKKKSVSKPLKMVEVSVTEESVIFSSDDTFHFLVFDVLYKSRVYIYME